MYETSYDGRHLTTKLPANTYRNEMLEQILEQTSDMATSSCKFDHTHGWGLIDSSA